MNVILIDMRQKHKGAKIFNWTVGSGLLLTGAMCLVRIYGLTEIPLTAIFAPLLLVSAVWILIFLFAFVVAVFSKAVNNDNKT